MRISWLPLYQRYGASSRLRVFSRHDNLSACGHESVIGFDARSDVLVVQKHQKVSDQVRAFSGFKVYDCDDREVYGALKEVAKVVDLVTTDTAGHRDEILDHTGGLVPVEVVPDPIDYGLSGIHPMAVGLGVVWFGFYQNVSAASEWLRHLSGKTPVRLISNSNLKVPWASCETWSLDSFPDRLRQSPIAVLSHDGPDRFKSNNKLITAIALGLCCITSRTPEYLQTLEEIGLGDFACDTIEQVDAAWVRLKEREERQRFLSAAQQSIWNRYNPLSITKQFIETINKVRGVYA